jgi:hypothetical protein
MTLTEHAAGPHGPAPAFDALPLSNLVGMIADTVEALGEVDERGIRRHFTHALDIPIPKVRASLFRKFIWSTKGRGLIIETDDDLGDWMRTDIPVTSVAVFGDETFESICDIVEALDPDREAAFDDLIKLTLQYLEDRGCQTGTRLVGRTAGSAIWATGRRSK